MANKILIVCYSRGGVTLRVARDLKVVLDADLDEIRESSSRSGGFGYSRSLVEAIAKGLPSIRTQSDPAAYDLVAIGTPVWAGSMSSPIRSYLFLHRDRLPRVAFFATMGGRGAQTVLADMQHFCGADDAPTMFATEREVRLNAYRPKLDRFAARLREAPPPTMRASEQRPMA